MRGIGSKMKIMVSACLLGENCKYNGGNNLNEKVLEFVKGHEVIPVCPEVLGGLSTPRIPAEIVDGVVKNKEGKSVDREFKKGAELSLNIAREQQIDLAILKSGSPSCGSKQIYDGSFSGHKIDGQGIFAKMLIHNGYQVINENEL